jgi:hypothetical protein
MHRVNAAGMPQYALTLGIGRGIGRAHKHHEHSEQGRSML